MIGQVNNSIAGSFYNAIPRTSCQRKDSSSPAGFDSYCTPQSADTFTASLSSYKPDILDNNVKTLDNIGVFAPEEYKEEQPSATQEISEDIIDADKWKTEPPAALVTTGDGIRLWFYRASESTQDNPIYYAKISKNGATACYRIEANKINPRDATMVEVFALFDVKYRHESDDDYCEKYRAMATALSNAEVIGATVFTDPSGDYFGQRYNMTETLKSIVDLWMSSESESNARYALWLNDMITFWEEKGAAG
jgi:hypothetical protein